MPIPAEFSQLVHNRGFQMAAVAVAGVGGYVLYKRKATTGSTSSTSTTAGTTTAGTGTLDTTGTDVANWMSNYDQNVSTELQQYLNQLNGAIDNLKNIPPQGTPSPTPSNPSTLPIVNVPPPIVKPAPSKSPPAAAQYVSVVKFTSRNPAWNSTLWGIANHYHTSVAALQHLNPQVKNPNLVYPGERIQVK